MVMIFGSSRPLLIDSLYKASGGEEIAGNLTALISIVSSSSAVFRLE
jgi:hypothetical protein